MNAIDVIAQQSGLIEAQLRSILQPGQPYALVDFPNHSNVGDSAIWLGEMALLQKVTGLAPRYVCDHHNYNLHDLRRLHPDGPILIHGGGNFGDIWPQHHHLRCAVLTDFPDRDVVQLPQTIHFGDAANTAHTARLIKAHGRFTLYARDRVSEGFARAHFDCPVQLLPDSAFGIGPVAPPVKPTHEAFMLLRSDAEQAGQDLTPLWSMANAARADWLDEPRTFVANCRFRTALRHRGRRGGRMESGRLDLYGYLARGRFARGVRMLSSGRVVITDRLHAHIISVLLNKAHVVMDNNYGKIFNYMDAWTGRFDGVWQAHVPQEAVQQHAQALQYRG